MYIRSINELLRLNYFLCFSTIYSTCLKGILAILAIRDIGKPSANISSTISINPAISPFASPSINPSILPSSKAV